MQVYKLTDQNLQTHNGYQWQINDWHETDGAGELCSKGWLHFYYSKELALFLNPMHADIANPKLFVAVAAGQFKDDHGLKGGCTKLRIVEELPVVMPTTEQFVKLGIYCAKAVTTDIAWNKWADAWLDGSDRSARFARSARSAGDAAWAAAWAAWDAAQAARSADAAQAARSAEAAQAAQAAAWGAWDATGAAEYAAQTCKAIDLIAIAKKAME
jgi:hypothetical protein